MNLSKKVVLALFITVFFASIEILTQPQAANLLNIRDTLSSSQLSYFGRTGAGNVIGEGIVNIDVSNTLNPSQSTSNLFVGDTVSIGTTAATLDNYLVTDVANTGTFNVQPGLLAVNDTTNLAIVATHSAIHTVDFTPFTEISDGRFEFLIKTSSAQAEVVGAGWTDSRGENGRNGIADQSGFDLGSNIGGGSTIGLGSRVQAADITCPLGGSAAVGTTATIGNGTFHIFSCTYSGLNSTSPYTMTVGRDLTTGSQLINPSPGIGHFEGSTVNPITGVSTDIYSFYIRHYNGSNLVDQTQGKVAVIEAVKITATVDPTLTFNIDTYEGVGNTGTGTMAVGDTFCGAPQSSGQENTTGTVVRFGSLVIDNFKTLAQRLSVVTNAPSGYTLTAYQDKLMTIVTNTGTTIPNTSCDSSCTHTTSSEWVTPTNYGLGYSLENLAGGTGIMSFVYNTSGSTFRAKRFGLGSGNAQTIMSQASTPASTDRAYVCYRISISPQQTAGDYESRIIYTATSTF